MKAVRVRRYGPPSVLTISEEEQPQPSEGQILIRVVNATVTAGDGEFRRMDFTPRITVPMRIYAGVRRPRFVLGMEFAGDVEEIADAHAYVESGRKPGHVILEGGVT